MKVLYLFGPNLGALGRREPSLYGSETLEEIMTSVEERAAGDGPRDRSGGSPITRGTWSAGSWGAAADGAGAVVINPGRADPLLLRAPRRDRGRRPARDRGAHVEHPGARGLPAPLRGERGLSRVDHRPGGRWLSSGPGGDAVDHLRRRNALAERCADLEVDALLVTKLANVRYLTGFTGSVGDRCSSRRPARCSSPTAATTSSPATRSRTSTGWRRWRTPPVRSSTVPGDSASSGSGSSAMRSPSRSSERWQERFDGIRLAGIGEEVERLRWAKDAEELADLDRHRRRPTARSRTSSRCSSSGITERQAAAQLELAMAAHGADALSFDVIVAFGEHAAEPHHRPCHRALGEGDVDQDGLRRAWSTGTTRT